MTEPIKGRVFDIRRFSVHDGQGIRTTIFLKGCPLHCVWCQNPEGICLEQKLVYFKDKCLHCGRCLSIEQKAMCEFDGNLHLDAAKVSGGAAYEDICPAGALRLDSREYTAAELVDEVLADQVFFARGGGITLSGGEPFFQPEFTLELLKRFQAAGIHTAVESSLQVDGGYLETVLPFIDHLFADCKIFSSQKHKAAVGVEPQIIQANITMVLESKYRDRLTVRTPLIPGYTATRENISAIAGWLSRLYPQVQYELLNYNPLARAKYAHVDFVYGVKENLPPYTKDEMAAWRACAVAAGCNNAIVEI